jgi:carboxyl-terminal processing protease
MIRLTIAHYYTPAGRCIQKPYVKGEADDYARDMQNRLRRGELTNADSIHFADSLKYYTLRRHRTVYGGGGIMPDNFVPLDTTMYTRYHRALQAKSLIIIANLNYVDQHRRELKEQYQTFAAYQQSFEVPESIIDDLIKEGEKQNVKPTDKSEQKASIPYIKLQLKALIARDLWGMDEYFCIMNERNPIVQEGIRLMLQD